MVSKVIKTWHRGEYSHVALFPNGPEGSVLEAWRGGVQENPHWQTRHKAGTKVDLFEPIFEIPERNERELLNFLRSQIGKKYDLLGIMGFATRRNWNALDRWFCSEYVCAGFNFINYFLFRRVEPHKISPVWMSRTPLLRMVGEIEL